jgi:hypothetical protein
MTFTLHHRYAYHDGIPLWWDLYIATWEWALPLRIKVRPWLVDGSGRKEHVINVELSLLYLHWSIHYAWGKRRYHTPPERILSLREVMEHDRSQPLTMGQDVSHNDA